MTESSESKPAQDDRGRPNALAEYADRLLLSTGLTADDALLLASGKQEPPAELEGLARALRAGWALDADQPA